MSLNLKTAPASEPLTLSEVKDYLRIQDTQDDALLTALITASRERAEAFTRRVWITQTWTLWLDRFPKEKASRKGWESNAQWISIPKPPLQSVAFLKTYDATNTATEFNPARYLVDNISVPGRIALNESETWPVDLRPVQSIEIEFTAGYGLASDVPEPVRQGMLLWIKLAYASKARLFEKDSGGDLLAMHQQILPPIVCDLWHAFVVHPAQGAMV